MHKIYMYIYVYIYICTSGSLHQLNDFNGFDGCGMFFDNVLEELIGLSVSEPKKNKTIKI